MLEALFGLNKLQFGNHFKCLCQKMRLCVFEIYGENKCTSLKIRIEIGVFVQKLLASKYSNTRSEKSKKRERERRN